MSHTVGTGSVSAVVLGGQGAHVAAVVRFSILINGRLGATTDWDLLGCSVAGHPERQDRFLLSGKWGEPGSEQLGRLPKVTQRAGV